MRRIKWFNIILVIFILLTIILSILLGIAYTQNKDNNLNINKNVTVTEDSLSSAVEKAIDAVVVVESYRNNQLIGTGTGFVYKKDAEYGYILTNDHVVNGGNGFKVLLNNKKVIDAVRTGGDAYSDIAVLRINVADVIKTSIIGTSAKSKLGDTVFTIGAPIGSDYSGTVTKGIISGKDRLITTALGNDQAGLQMRVLQTDAAINPGNSGGPLLNINAEVIGINSLKLVEDEVEGMGFAIPIEDVIQYTDYLEKGQRIERPYLGLGLVDLTDSYTLMQLNISVLDGVKNGVVVGAVYSDGPKKINLQKGDIITKLNEDNVTNKASLRYHLYKYKVGEQIKISYIRNGLNEEVSIILVKQPS